MVPFDPEGFTLIFAGFHLIARREQNTMTPIEMREGAVAISLSINYCLANGSTIKATDNPRERRAGLRLRHGCARISGHEPSKEH